VNFTACAADIGARMFPQKGDVSLSHFLGNRQDSGVIGTMVGRSTILDCLFQSPDLNRDFTFFAPAIQRVVNTVFQSHRSYYAGSHYELSGNRWNTRVLFLTLFPPVTPQCVVRLMPTANPIPFSNWSAAVGIAPSEKISPIQSFFSAHIIRCYFELLSGS
jgi:hypothetical protein